MNRGLELTLHWFKMDIHIRTNRTTLAPIFIFKLLRVEPFAVLEIFLQTIYVLHWNAQLSESKFEYSAIHKTFQKVNIIS